jgi:hypothetical protein
MADPFEKHMTGLDSPAKHAASVTPDDGTDLTTVARALYIGGAGDVAVVTAGGDTVTFASIQGWMPVRTERVLATGTTATQIVALW